MTIMFSIGKWGGFYWHRDFSIRLCLGWVAITLLPVDVDEIMNWAMVLIGEK